MSTLFHDTAMNMPASSGPLMGVMTLLFMGVFLGWFWYAYAPSRRELMDQYGNLPFDGE